MGKSVCIGPTDPGGPSVILKHHFHFRGPKPSEITRKDDDGTLQEVYLPARSKHIIEQERVG